VLFSSRFSAKRRAVYSVSSVPAERSVAAPSGRLRCPLSQQGKFWVAPASSSAASNGKFRSKLAESGHGLCRKRLAQWLRRVAPLPKFRKGFVRAVGFARHRLPSATIEVNSATMAAATKTTATPGSLEFSSCGSARAITNSSSGRGVTFGPAKPGWFLGRAA
jgi:hypothetical protein